MSDKNGEEARQIAECVVGEALASELILTVRNGTDEPHLYGSTDKATIMNAMFHQELTLLTISMPDGEDYGHVLFKESLGHQAIVDFRGPHYYAVEAIIEPAIQLSKRMEGDPARTLEIRKEIVAGLREQGEGSQHRVEGGVYSIDGRALILRDGKGEVSGRWFADNVECEVAIGQATDPEMDMTDLLAEDIFPDLADERTAELRAMREELDGLFEERLYDEAEKPRLGKVVAYLSAQGEDGHYRTENDCCFTLKDGQLHQTWDDPEHETESWYIYDANDLSLVDSHVHERKRIDDEIEVQRFEYDKSDALEELRSKEEGARVEYGHGANFQLEGELLVFNAHDGKVFVWHADDLGTELTDHRARAEQTPAARVTEAVLDKVFENNADAHMRSVHGFDERATPTLSSEQVAQLPVQTAEDDKLMQIAHEVENGFPSEFMGDELHELKTASNFARDYWAENSPHPTPSMETPSEAGSSKSYSVEDGMLCEIAFDSESKVSWNVYEVDAPDNLIDSMELQRSGQATRPSTFSLMKRFEMGEERPPEVSEDKWEAVAKDYHHYMVMENTDDEFIPGTAAYRLANYGDDHAYDDYGAPDQTFSGPDVSEKLWEEAANSLLLQVMEREAWDAEPVFGNEDATFHLELGCITCTSNANGETSIWDTSSYARVSNEDFANLRAEAYLREEQRAAKLRAAAGTSDAPASDVTFDLTSVMASTAKAIDDGRTVPDRPTGTATPAAPKPQVAQADAPTEAKNSLPFPQRRGPDFTTAPAPKKNPEDEKLTSLTVIIQLNDFDIKPKLATDEIARRGAGVAVTRKAYRVDGTEIAASYEFTKGGKVLHTGYDGKQTEMTFEQAKRHEIAEINLLNRNAIIAINKMSTDATFTLRQGDATFSVKGNFFVRTKDDGTVTKEPLAETQKRFSERGREIRAMGGPELDPKPPTNAMQAVQPKPEKTQRFARMADRADAAAAHENKSGKTLESGNQLGA
ncbi:hypothetical protein HFN65_31175 [Rhizobium laguerreae]|uniref:hypothetical protein n=1 Tax=Rhizobium laguerreae TaxID=1076926 RepID=UPI001C91832A|nr:hypothetical protein [Rhizobium laguerreae]MBY3575401.1 hypothetical protein [Rhizobium laguerreae]